MFPVSFLNDEKKADVQSFFQNETRISIRVQVPRQEDLP